MNDSEKTPTPEISSPQSACSLVHCRMNPRRPRSLARTWLGSVDLGRHILHAFDLPGLSNLFTFLYRFVLVFAHLHVAWWEICFFGS